MSDARTRLTQVISQVLGVEPASISDASSPATIPAWDSVNHLNLVMALESEFGLSLSPEDALAMNDVRAMQEILRHRGAKV